MKRSSYLLLLFMLCFGPIYGQRFSKDNLGYADKYYGKYTVTFSPHQANFIVKDKGELLAALKQVKQGQRIYISDNAVINLTGVKGISIPAGVTIGSGRRNRGAAGALLYTDSLNTFPLFNVTGNDVRFTGVRLQGPDTARRETQMRLLYSQNKGYSIANSCAIASQADNLTVDNCEIWGWSHSAVFLKSGSRNNSIHHNYIHHNQRQGLGYGICLDAATAKIFANVFEWNNHSVAATGKKGTGYEAYDNVVLNSTPDSPVFDMHGGRDRKDGTDIAGDSVVIYNNIIYSNSNIFGIRGTPIYKYEIHDNIFINGSANFNSLKDIGTRSFMKVYNNKQVRSN